MRRYAVSTFAAVFATVFATACNAAVLSSWVEMTRGGSAELRAVVDLVTCPDATIDGARQAMQARATFDVKFPVQTCDLKLPAGAKTATLEGKPVPLPVSDPKRILVLGDTGCRITERVVQDCSDISKWPFPEVARSAAKLRPDLVIHVGDYLYREAQCPSGNAGCAGTPWGDKWATWAADFFTPAAPLLAASPWVIVRGNHENCQRSGPGFLRLLGPDAYDPAAPCADHIASYAVPLAGMSLVVFDDTAAPNTSVNEKLLPAYRSDFSSLATIAPQPIWLIMHEPIWAAISGPFGTPVGGTPSMIEASGDQSTLAPVSLLLAGHIHSFEAINYAARVPPQIVAGHGGDVLDPTPVDLKGAIFQGNSGVTVKDGLSVGGFGFLLMSKVERGWTIDLYKVDGTTEGQCLFAAGRVDCKR